MAKFDYDTVQVRAFETAAGIDSGSYLTLYYGNGNPVDGRKIKGTIHWLSAANCKDITVMHYDKLFTIANTGDIPEDKTYDDYINPDSAEKIEGGKAELSLGDDEDTHYYVKDSKNPGTFNRIVSLKDSYRPEA